MNFRFVPLIGVLIALTGCNWFGSDTPDKSLVLAKTGELFTEKPLKQLAAVDKQELLGCDGGKEPAGKGAACQVLVNYHSLPPIARRDYKRTLVLSFVKSESGWTMQGLVAPEFGNDIFQMQQESASAAFYQRFGFAKSK